MKELVLFLSILLKFSVYSQQCVNDVNTHPDHQPTQNHLDALPVNSGNPDERFLNGWEWWYDHDPQSSNSIPLNNMGLNPGETYGSFMEHFNSDASQGFYFYLSKDYQEVMLPENGWELLANNRGWYPDLDSEVPMNHSTQEWTESTSLRKLPYLMFYNKFTGIARVFVKYGNNEPPAGSINAAEITIRHPDELEMSGLLRLADGYDRTLDQKSIIHKVTSVVKAPGSASKWFSADFQLTLDPCVCYHESSFQLDFRFLTTASIDVHGGSLSVPINLVENNTLIEQDFLGSFDNSNGVDNGYMIYKEMASMVDDYYDRLKAYQDSLDLVNKHNAKVDANVALLEIAKTVFTTGITAVTGIPNYTSLIGLVPSLKNKSDKATFGKETQKAFWKELDKALGIAFDFMMKENFTKKEAPEEPSMPTATATEMRFSGDLTYSTPEIQSSVINTPGSENAKSNGINLNRPQRYPIYNEALGVFALLESPKVRVSRTVSSICSSEVKDTVGFFKYYNLQGQFIGYKKYEDYENISNNQTYVIRETYFIPRREVDNYIELQMVLDEPLKYAFNPALNIKDYSIDVALVTKGNMASASNNYNPYNNINFNFSDHVSLKNNPYNSVNIESTSFNVNETDLFTIGDTIDYNSIYLSKDAFLSHQYQFGYDKTFIYPNQENLLPKTDSEYNNYLNSNLNLTNLDDCMEFSHSNFESISPRFERDEVYLKLLINVTYEGEKSDGSPHEYTYMFTYKVDDISEDINPTNPNLGQSFGDITQFPENLYLTGVDFDGSAVEGCVLDGTTYNCKAWNIIEVMGDYTVASNYVVNVVAGNEINIDPEANPVPEMNFMTGVLDYSNPMPPQEPDTVVKFCKGNDSRYRANEAKSGNFIVYDSITEVQNEREVLDLDAHALQFNLDVYPNPTSGQTSVNLTLPEASTTSITVTNLMGKQLLNPVQQEQLMGGEHLKTLPTESLAPGIYLIVVNVDGKRHVKRIVKQ